jgi:hypothetical protein
VVASICEGAGLLEALAVFAGTLLYWWCQQNTELILLLTAPAWPGLFILQQ